MLEINNLKFKYKNNVVFEDVNIKLGAGIYFLQAGNGVGKSTLFSLMLKKYNYQGDMLYNGDKLERKMISTTPQANVLLDIEVEKMLVLLHCDIEKARVYMQKFLIPNINIAKLSGGQRQKLMILISIMCEVPIILLDEPFNNIDRNSKDVIFNEILKLENKIIIITMHPKDNIEKKMLEKGTLIELKKTMDFYSSDEDSSGVEKLPIKRNYLYKKKIIITIMILLITLASYIMINNIEFTNTLKIFKSDEVTYYNVANNETTINVVPADTQPIEIEAGQYKMQQIKYPQEVVELLNSPDIKIDGEYPKDNTKQIIVPTTLSDVDLEGYEIVGYYTPSSAQTTTIYLAYQENKEIETAGICVSECTIEGGIKNKDTLNSVIDENKKQITILMLIFTINIAAYYLLRKIIPYFMIREINFNLYYDIKSFSLVSFDIVYFLTLAVLIIFTIKQLFV